VAVAEAAEGERDVLVKDALTENKDIACDVQPSS
jgi:hypothetical protein